MLCLLIVCSSLWSSEYSFVAYDVNADKIVLQEGPNCNVRMAPACSFNIALSLMGFDSGVLINENVPEWPYENQPTFWDSQKADQTPKSWIQLSVFWFSQILTPKIGAEKINEYLAKFNYGNQDMSGGIACAWLTTLKISPMEQVHFLKKLVKHELPVSEHALQMTQNILYTETCGKGWNLFGKTGTTIEGDNVGAWYAGWIEKEGQFYVFALNIQLDDGSIPTKAERIELTKTLLNKI